MENKDERRAWGEVSGRNQRLKWMKSKMMFKLTTALSSLFYVGAHVAS